MKKLVLFDFDGTLADTAPDLAAAANKQRASQGLPDLPYEALRPYASHGARGLLRAALGLLPEDPDYDQWRQRFLADYAREIAVHTALFPGMAELLDQIEGHGHAWGIVTNKVEHLARPIIQHLGIAARCAVTVGGDTTPYSKPHPEPLLHAARIVGIAPADCIYIGDDHRDVVAGRAAGMATVVAAYGYCSLEDPSTWQADALADTPDGLWPLIQAWSGGAGLRQP